jgi:3-oxoacyl-[acyl-carrier protein] reductase
MPGDRLNGKAAIVTGGGSGFGATIVQKFVSEGCLVLVWDIDSAAATRVADSVGRDHAVPFAGDVSKSQDWRTALNLTLEKFGKLDILVNNAGVVHVAKPSEEVEEEEVDRMWKINVKPLYYSAQVIVPYFRKEKRPGVVVNLSSILAPRPRPKLVWYAASKGAVTAVSE